MDSASGSESGAIDFSECNTQTSKNDQTIEQTSAVLLASSPCQCERTEQQSLSPPRCRVCYETESLYKTQCKCRGSIGYMDKKCMYTMFIQTGVTRCDVCHQEMPFRRRKRSFLQWMVAKPTSNVVFKFFGVFFLLSQFVLFPIAVCGVTNATEQYESGDKSAADYVSLVGWTIVGLITDMALLVMFIIWAIADFSDWQDKHPLLAFPRDMESVRFSDL